MTALPRIAVAIRSIGFGDGVGGMERAGADHIRALAEAGVTVDLYTPRASLDDAPRGVHVHDVPWPTWAATRGPLFSAAYTQWVRRLGRALQTSEADIAHLHGGAVGALFTADGSSIGRPAVTNPHGMEEYGDASSLRRLSRLPIRRLSQRSINASAVIATDRSLVTAVEHNLGVDRRRIHVIPNSVDVDKLRSLATLTQGNGFSIVTVGRVVHNKGYDLLITALATIARDLPAGWQWHHYGSGPESASLQSAAHQHSVPLHLHPGRSDAEVQSAIAASDLFVQPSRYEGSSLTTLEAMAQGCLIVGTRVGGIPDKIDDGVTGFLAEPDAADIAVAIGRALSSDGITIRHAAAARVRAEFSIAATTQRYIELYQLLCSNPGLS